MGLDMYLYKKTYVKNWEHQKQKYEVSVKRDKKLLKHIQPSRVAYVIEDVGYWRKANAIHKWFVDNVQDGEDNNKESYVSKEDLQNLLKIVDTLLEKLVLVDGKVKNSTTYNKEHPEGDINWEKGKVIKNPALAQKLLPTGEGFFFGSYEYDEWYYKDLQDTKKILESAVKDYDTKDSVSIYYESSW